MNAKNTKPNLIKTTQENLPVNGATKAAILYAELGADVTQSMVGFFSNKELKQLKLSLKKLMTYDVRQEISVLEEALDYGEKKGIAPKKQTPKSTMENQASNFRSSASSDPSSMAALIRTWISSEKH